MYIEFVLPDRPNVAIYVIADALKEWSQRYQIPYKSKLHKNFKRVTFDSDESYSLFAMTWNPDQKYRALVKWRIVSDLNNKIEFNSVL